MPMFKKEYTEKIHAKRLLAMLEVRNPCKHYPAAERYSSNNDPTII